MCCCLRLSLPSGSRGNQSGCRSYLPVWECQGGSSGEGPGEHGESEYQDAARSETAELTQRTVHLSARRRKQTRKAAGRFMLVAKCCIVTV